MCSGPIEWVCGTIEGSSHRAKEGGRKKQKYHALMLQRAPPAPRREGGLIAFQFRGPGTKGCAV